VCGIDKEAPDKNNKRYNNGWYIPVSTASNSIETVLYSTKEQ
jgi:hypothetical protein